MIAINQVKKENLEERLKSYQVNLKLKWVVAQIKRIRVISLKEKRSLLMYSCSNSEKKIQLI
ncbi:MAG: hypothetical protein ACI9DJ_001422 [Algoriphagus sp.]|jgi:hypothetical protein